MFRTNYHSRQEARATDSVSKLLHNSSMSVCSGAHQHTSLSLTAQPTKGHVSMQVHISLFLEASPLWQQGLVSGKTFISSNSEEGHALQPSHFSSEGMAQTIPPSQLDPSPNKIYILCLLYILSSLGVPLRLDRFRLALEAQ